MTTPSDPGASRPEPGVDLGKPRPADPTPPADPPFDPYRFGKPERPVPPEYAPPGYVPDPADYPSAPTYPSGQPGPSAGAYPRTPYPGPPQPGTPEPYAPYGAPAPPQWHGYVQPQTGNGKAIAALVLGGVSIPLCFASVLDAALIIPALILGIIALTESKAGQRGGRGLAIAGLACATVGALLAALVTAWYLHAANQCGGLNQTNSSQFKQCLQEHL